MGKIFVYVEVKVKVIQSCLTLCDPVDCIVHGILQARILEWITFPFSRESSQPRNRTRVSCIAARFSTSLSQALWKEFFYITLRLGVTSLVSTLSLSLCSLTQFNCHLESNNVFHYIKSILCKDQNCIDIKNVCILSW